MICYVCEKTIFIEKNEYVLFNYFGKEYSYVIRNKPITIETGFHLNCLKDSLGEDFWLFFKERNK